MQIGEVALSTLEVFGTFSEAQEERTLLSILDKTRTAPGRRLLRAWLRHPLLDQDLLEHRLNATQALVKDAVLRREVRKGLYKMHDLERLASRLAAGRASARDLCALARSLSLVPELHKHLSGPLRRGVAIA